MKQRLLHAVLAIPPRKMSHLATGFVLLTMLALAAILRTPFSNWQLLRTERLQSQNALMDISSLQQIASQLTADVDRLSKRLARHGTTPDRLVIEVVRDMNRLSLASGVILGSVTPGLPNPFLMFHEIPFAVEVSGRYQDLMHWLQKVEAEIPQLSISGIEASRQPGSTAVTIRARIAVYQYSEKP